jgi:hypothetical protein
VEAYALEGVRIPAAEEAYILEVEASLSSLKVVLHLVPYKASADTTDSGVVLASHPSSQGMDRVETLDWWALGSHLHRNTRQY